MICSLEGDSVHAQHRGLQGGGFREGELDDILQGLLQQLGRAVVFVILHAAAVLHVAPLLLFARQGLLLLLLLLGEGDI